MHAYIHTYTKTHTLLTFPTALVTAVCLQQCFAPHITAYIPADHSNTCLRVCVFVYAGPSAVCCPSLSVVLTDVDFRYSSMIDINYL